MYASLPMYDRAETAPAHDALWHLIRDNLRHAGIAAPDALDREIEHVEGWGRADLVLGQICNLPYRARFRANVTRIGASDFGMQGVPAGHYHTSLIVRGDDVAERLEDCAGYRLAYNNGLSQSGWGALEARARGVVGLHPILVTGSHAASLGAVADGGADMACIDSVTLRILAESERDVAQIKVIEQIPAGPGMTFITAGQVDPAPYFAAVAAAISALDRASATLLGLRGLVDLPERDYDIPLAPDPLPVPK